MRKPKKNEGYTRISTEKRILQCVIKKDLRLARYVKKTTPKGALRKSDLLH